MMLILSVMVDHHGEDSHTVVMKGTRTSGYQNSHPFQTVAGLLPKAVQLGMS